MGTDTREERGRAYQVVERGGTVAAETGGGGGAAASSAAKIGTLTVSISIQLAPSGLEKFQVWVRPIYGRHFYRRLACQPRTACRYFYRRFARRASTRKDFELVFKLFCRIILKASKIHILSNIGPNIVKKSLLCFY